jgi:hypothetical protein
MKTTIALATMMLGGFAAQAYAQDERSYDRRHERSHEEKYRWEKQEFTERVLVGYEDVWVCKTVTEYETRSVTRRVLVGYDCCDRPIYRCIEVCERVPVCRTIRVCEKRPVYENRTVCRWVKVRVNHGCDD